MSKQKENKFIYVEKMDDTDYSVEDFRNIWHRTFEEMREEGSSLSWESFLEQDYYDEGDYILDTETGKFYDANDFYHKHNDLM
ncbi:MAG: hypothetical protein IKS54_08670 [Erysipelotrichaceae bacterium]|nr:hypothetical protein [Erysipelotrichaceae bacterium]